MLRIGQAEQGVLCRASRWIRLKAPRGALSLGDQALARPKQ